MAIRVRKWHSTASRRTRAGRAGLLLLLALVVVSGSALIAGAAVPAAPNNILVFPNRDFVTVEGFADHAGETATVEISRGGTVVGAAQGVVSGGDVAFEINHPGGVCWGAGTSMKVTPDIQPGDKATIRFGATAAGDTVVQDAYVEKLAYDPDANPTRVIVTGRLDRAINVGNVEQRIVNPELVPLIGKRDVRALPGPSAPAPKGGYSSGLETDAATNSFTATYDFDSASVAQVVANGGGERLLTWQVTDGAGNRQGVTIAELGELGGPGMGGCPAGPADQSAPTGTAKTIRSADKTSIQVDWTAATPQPGAAAVTGYSVDVIEKSSDASGQQVSVGRRTSANATRATIGGLSAAEAYTIEVRSLAGPRMSEAFPIAPDTTPPTLTADPAPSATGSVPATSVTLTSNGQIYYTTDGSPAITGDTPTDNAKPYDGAIAITGHTVLSAAAFDIAGNHTQLDGVYDPPGETTTPPAGDPPAGDPPPPPMMTVPDAPTGLAGTAGDQQVALTWDATDATITGYRVQTYDAAGAVGDPTPSTDKAVTITGLTAAKEYFFTVTAQNAKGWGAESAKTAAIKPRDAVTIGTAKWKAGDFRVTGGASVVGAVVSLRVGSPTAPAIATATVTAAAAPQAGGVFDLRARNGAAPATRPATIYVTSNKGGTAGPFSGITG
jgi:hypothetical protein